MKNKKILHLFGWNKKFFLPFRDYINQHFEPSSHQFIVYGGDAEDREIETTKNTLIIPNLIKGVIQVLKYISSADKVIIHSLTSSHLLYILALQPWILKKCYWVVWGGDLYTWKKSKNWRWHKNELFRKFVIPRIGFYVTGNVYDYRLIHEKYGGNSPRIDCVCYPTNIISFSANKQDNNSNNTTILVGNSADPSNNHIEIFSIIKKYCDSQIEILCPLSYGDRKYADTVMKAGEEIFGNKFFPLTNFIPYSEYLELLQRVDIAAFAHRRQQAFGNKIQLLGMGKKVFLSRESNLWQYFSDLDVKVFDIQDFNLEGMDEESKIQNKNNITSKFSEENLLESLAELFESRITNSSTWS